MNTWLVGLMVCIGLVAPGASVAGSGNHASDVQASMIVTGDIVIKPDGSVASYALDKTDELPAGVIAETAKAVPRWKFQPVLRDGKPVRAKATMSLRMVAIPVDDGKSAIGISGARFGNGKAGTFVSEKHMSSPRYPELARQDGVTGTVYLVLQVGRDGTVMHVAAQQVDLRARGPAAQMKDWRRAFAHASVRAARHWMFNPPVRGPRASDSHWNCVIPVTFRLDNERRVWPRYGQWVSYIPGPRRYVPWLKHDAVASGSADALPAGGGLYPAQQTLHLLSALGNAGASGPL